MSDQTKMSLAGERNFFFKCGVEQECSFLRSDGQTSTGILKQINVTADGVLYTVVVDNVTPYSVADSEIVLPEGE